MECILHHRQVLYVWSPLLLVCFCLAMTPRVAYCMFYSHYQGEWLWTCYLFISRIGNNLTIQNLIFMLLLMTKVYICLRHIDVDRVSLTAIQCLFDFSSDHTAWDSAFLVWSYATVHLISTSKMPVTRFSDYQNRRMLMMGKL